MCIASTSCSILTSSLFGVQTHRNPDESIKHWYSIIIRIKEHKFTLIARLWNANRILSTRFFQTRKKKQKITRRRFDGRSKVNKTIVQGRDRSISIYRQTIKERKNKPKEVSQLTYTLQNRAIPTPTFFFSNLWHHWSNYWDYSAFLNIL